MDRKAEIEELEKAYAEAKRKHENIREQLAILRYGEWYDQQPFEARVDSDLYQRVYRKGFRTGLFLGCFLIALVVIVGGLHFLRWLGL